MSARRAVLVTTRVPRPGHVKTRLVPELGAQGAAELQRCMLLDVLDALAGLPATDTVVAFTPPEAGQEMRRLVERPVLLLPQRGRDLGERMAAAIEDILALGLGPVATVGSDLPTLSPAQVEAAFRFLEGGSTDVVLGPTPDGGYYLVGLRTPQPQLFAGVAMSGDSVLEATLRRAEAAGLAVAQVAPCRDIDTPSDLLRLKEELATHPPPTAQRTRRFFSRG